MTSNTNTTTSVSYRRDRDYSKQFKWTYELNKDLYNYYTRARENPKKGYTKRMKVLWDDLHPELSYFNGKYLRQQSIYITQRSYILETRAENDEETNVIAQNPFGPSTAENGNITVMISTPSHAENVYETVRTIDNKELYDTLRRSFEANYKVYESIEMERTDLTTVRKKFNEEELLLIAILIAINCKSYCKIIFR